MTDRELLELAAKAAGIEVRCGTGWESDYLYRDLPRPNSPLTSSVRWNPLDDDGDALRLAVKLKMELIVHERLSCAAADGLDGFLRRSEHHKGDPDAATRRAIVRAAAEIGRNMK